MKLTSFLTGLCLFFATAVFAQEKADSVKVWGNCGMCKSNIEKAAKAAGASYAFWNKDTKMLSVKYETSKTSNRQIQEKIAATGYDTKDLTGDQKAYDELEECCKYDRKAVTEKADKDKKTAMNNCCKPEKKDCCKTEQKDCCKQGEQKDCCKDKKDCCKHGEASC